MNASSGWPSRLFDREEHCYQSRSDLITEIQVLRMKLKDTLLELALFQQKMIQIRTLEEALEKSP